MQYPVEKAESVPYTCTLISFMNRTLSPLPEPYGYHLSKQTVTAGGWHRLQTLGKLTDLKSISSS
jgi:hypothetical protein